MKTLGLKATLMGCGSSHGVPSAGGFWGKCDPNEPRNERLRAALHVESKNTHIVVDAGHDIRQQLNRAQLKRVDGLLLTHSHSDHINGLDDFRAIERSMGKLIDVYSNLETIAEVERLWPHLFRGSADGTYPATMNRHIIEPYKPFTIGDVTVEAVEQDHGSIMSMGYRFGSFAYCVDLAGLSDEALERLQGIETWVVGCASYYNDTVRNHANLKAVMEWVSILQPKMTYLSVLTSALDYKTLCDELPPHIRPAYDGLVIEF